MGCTIWLQVAPVPLATPVTITLPAGLTPTGLTLPNDLSETEWKDIGTQLNHTEALQWALGDWYLWGKQKWGTQAAKKLAAETGKSIKTVYAYAEVAEQIEFSRRIEKL